MIRRLIFWEPSASPHKFQLFERIAAQRPSLEVRCFCAADLLPARKALGWGYAPPRNFSLAVGTAAMDYTNEIVDRPDHLHIFSGIRHVPLLTCALDRVLDSAAKFAILSEPRVSEGVSGLARRIQSLLTEGNLTRRCGAVFAIGRHGPAWFTSVGYPKERVFPFAYFVDPPTIVDAGVSKLEADRLPVFGYLGRLTKEKGYANVLKVFEGLGNSATLTVAGDGDLAGVTRRAFECGAVSGRYMGAIAIDSVGDFFRAIDVLVVPSISTNDGWGVVVSEALMAGVPVIVSPLVGSSICMNRPEFGTVMNNSSTEALKSSVLSWIRNRPAFDDIGYRTAIRNSAVQCLSARRGASYFLEIIDHLYLGLQRPAPPWAVSP